MDLPDPRDEPLCLPPPDSLGTALWLAGRGLWPIAITALDDKLSANPGKAPIGRRWGVQRPSREMLHTIFEHHPRAGVGIVLGPASGVVDLEVDDPQLARSVLQELFPAGTPPTMGWMSMRGEHRLFLWDDRLNSASSAVIHLAGGALELRLGSGGKQVAAVCPPSPIFDGSPRLWNGIWKIAPCPVALIDSVDRLIRAPPAEATSRFPTRRPRYDTGNRYGLVALEREAALVKAAGPGTRNEVLIRAAFRLGQLVGSGIIDRELVASGLALAASASGLGEREVSSTIRRGINAGALHPRRPVAKS